MGKDPAFLFFPGDWLGGTITMTRHQKGAYMDLLMVQFNAGHMDAHMVNIVLGEKDFSELWEKVLRRKFKQDENGLFYNEKLEKEIVKRKNYTESRKTNLSSLSHMDKHMGGHMDSHMENGNGNRNKEEKKKEKKGVGKKEKTIAEKKPYADNVIMTEVEYEKLITKYGEQDTLWMINKLNSYKNSKGKKYKSDYSAILTWVVDSMLEFNTKRLKIIQGNGNNLKGPEAINEINRRVDEFYGAKEHTAVIHN
jgi:hypothetical protein